MRKLVLPILLGGVLFLLSCNKSPAEVYFLNLKNYNYMTDNLVKKANDKRELWEFCSDNVTKKPGVILSTTLNKKLNTSKVTLQIIDNKTGGVIISHESDTNPDMTGLSTWYNFNTKGDYTVNFIAKDKIIAKGKIKYE